MQTLIENHIKIVKQLKASFRRDLVNNIDWKDRLICIKGARGVGKTTLMLQYIKDKNLNVDNCLYITMDNLYFTQNKLVTLADEFSKMGQHFSG